MKYVDVVVNVPLTPPRTASIMEGEGEQPAPFAWLDQTFTYEVPLSLQRQIAPGQLVWVPFGGRRLQGIVVGHSDTTSLEETRPVEDIVETRPLLSAGQIELARWISHRYLAPLSQCIWLMLPPGMEEKVETIYQIAPDSPEESRLSDKQREALQLVGTGRGIRSTRIPPRLRGPAEFLVQRGYLVRRTHVKPPRAKPRRIKAARLVGDPAEIERVLGKLLRRNLRASIVETLAQAEAPLSLDELCERAGCRPQVVHGLAKSGVVEIIPPQKSFSLTPKYFETLPALSPAAARLLVFLRERAQGATYQEIYDSTHTTPSSLRSLVSRGLIGENEEPERVRLILPPDRTSISHSGSSHSNERSSPLARIVEFLRREQSSTWISAIYAATGGSMQDLRKLERAGIVRLEMEEVDRDPLAHKEFLRQAGPALTDEQSHAFAEIRRGLEARSTSVYLLHGVTGSGKTEIYLCAIEQVLNQGRQAIALVPEIALTPQTIQRFGARFGSRIGVVHSGLSYGERFDTWRRAREGKIDVLIGPRSALFAPLPRLGLIVIDEEHEPSYKQEGDAGGLHLPLYHTREVALELARSSGASVILGSATPDVETFSRALGGEFKLLELPQRVLAHLSAGEPVRYQELPPVQVVDLRVELREGNSSIFSRSLSGAINDALMAREQVILFLNRRGAATAVLCRACGHTLKCPRCNNPYTLHQIGAETATELVCHHCGKRGRVPRTCPNCGSTRIRGLGLGTEKLEQVVRESFPAARTLRWDWDVTRGKGSHEKILEAFRRGEADVLIGTQMIAKGLDLPRVTLVGVISADTALNLPDFRAGERTFQLLTQVAGRAGRSALGGKVIIQTYTPDHYAVAAAARHDYRAFYEQEIRFRREAAYPPFRPLIRLLFANSRESVAREAGAQLTGALQDRIRRQGLPDVELIGPAPAFFAKWGGQYRYHLILRGKNARTLLAAFPLPLSWRVDVDPMSLL